MNLLSIFNSSSKAVDTAANVVEKSVGGLISGIDKMFYTDEEKATARKAAFDVYMPAWLDLQKTMASEGSATAISRRILAFMIMGPFLSMILCSAIVYKFDPEWSKFIMSAGGPVDRMEFLAGGVGLTYFMYYGVTKIFQSKKE